MAPQIIAAVIPEPQGRLEVVEIPYSPHGPKDVVIKNGAVAINPVDWKMQDEGLFLENYPSVFGVDVAGTIEEVGSEVTAFAPGDRVAANAPCLTLGEDYAAFQSLVRCPSNLVCKIPDHITFEEACVLPLAVNTAAQGLFAKDFLNIQKPLPVPRKDASHDAIFIYSGSTSVGSTAIQLSKAAGLFIVTTSSQTNFQYCKDLGADVVLDYREPNWMEAVANALSGKQVKGAFDSIGTAATASAITQVLSRVGAPSLIATVGPSQQDFDARQVFGTDVTLDEALAKSIWTDFLPHALANGSFKPKPDPFVVGKGLESIQKGMELQRRGVSARKVVVIIA